MMKILWFEMKVPGRYQEGKPIGGWQDALENIICKEPNVQLGVAFKTTNKNAVVKVIDGITYIPLYYSLNSLTQKIKDKFSWAIERDVMLSLEVKAINLFKPDIIQVFGTEWPYGQVQKLTEIPVVAHMQGSIPPYSLSRFPPGYSAIDNYKVLGFRLLSYIGHYLFDRKAESRKIIEIDTIKTVKYYLGRTEWDKSVVYLYNPSAKYYYCAEALREVFYASNEKWFPKKGKHKIRIVTTGCTSYVKGMNVLLLTAKLLVENNIDFEWIVVGNCDRKKEIETHEQLKFSDYNVRFNGYTSADELKQILLSSDMYVHLAYIENSPNSICEAQILGVPVIASYVGGVPCLVHNGEDGILIPSNDPYLAAFNIIGLSGDIDKQLYLSHRAIRVAEMRHNPDSITQDLLNAYRNIINYNK